MASVYSGLHQRKHGVPTIQWLGRVRLRIQWCTDFKTVRLKGIPVVVIGQEVINWACHEKNKTIRNWYRIMFSAIVKYQGHTRDTPTRFGLSPGVLA